jgi:hypothetical protein
MYVGRSISAFAILLASWATGDAVADEDSLARSPPPSETLAAHELLKWTPPVHYCAPDPRLDADYLALARTSHAATGHDLLVLWRDCKTLAASRTGLEDYSKPSIAITAKVEHGHILHLSMTRAAFLGGMGRWLATSHGNETAAQPEGTKGADQPRLRYLGVLANDERAVYVGSLIDQSVNGKPTVLAFVLGATLIKGLFIQVSVSEAFDGDVALRNEISYARQIVDRLVADNPDTPATSN